MKWCETCTNKYNSNIPETEYQKYITYISKYILDNSKEDMSNDDYEKLYYDKLYEIRNEKLILDSLSTIIKAFEYWEVSTYWNQNIWKDLVFIKYKFEDQLNNTYKLTNKND